MEYKQKRFEQIAQECWYISDNIHTSYKEVLDLSVTERNLLIKFIGDKQRATQKAMEELKQKK